MCIILDTNTLPQVFDRTNTNHDEFKPIFEWIMNGKGKVIFGGSKYSKEIGKFIEIFTELRRINKAIKIEDCEVDKVQKEIENKIKNKNFDDPHLVSLLILSKCKLICSLDKRAYPYFKNLEYFKGKSKPKIYSSKKNKKLLKDNYIAEICKCKNS